MQRSNITGNLNNLAGTIQISIYFHLTRKSIKSFLTPSGNSFSCDTPEG
jgi:hypothetical protein